MSLICVTNDMKGIKSCITHGQHASHCDGWRGIKECQGCLPKKAQHGLLCRECWERLVHTMNMWPEFAQLVSSLDRLVTPENAGVRGKAGSRVPIPQTWLDVEEAESFLHSYKTAGSNLDYWVSSTEGAKDSINFRISAERAIRTHPLEEKAHRIKTARCSECKCQSLVWIPTQHLGDDVKVICQNIECNHQMDQTTFELLALTEGANK